jgi:hypothetical protein
MQIKQAIDNQLHSQMVEARENGLEPSDVVPGVRITGENYKVGGIKGIIAQVASYGNVISLGIIFGG